MIFMLCIVCLLLGLVWYELALIGATLRSINLNIVYCSKDVQDILKNRMPKPDGNRVGV